MRKPDLNQNFIEKCYKDSDGKVVVGQFPNLPLITWIIATLLLKVIYSGAFSQLLEIIAFGAIFTWAWLEIFSGSTYLRRILGVTVLCVSIYSRMHAA